MVSLYHMKLRISAISKIDNRIIIAFLCTKYVLHKFCMVCRYTSFIIHNMLVHEIDIHILIILASLYLIKICLYSLVIARDYYKKNVYYLLNKRESAYKFIMVPSNFTRNCVNFSIRLQKNLRHMHSPCGTLRANHGLGGGAGGYGVYCHYFYNRDLSQIQNKTSFLALPL